MPQLRGFGKGRAALVAFCWAFSGKVARIELLSVRRPGSICGLFQTRRQQSSSPRPGSSASTGVIAQSWGEGARADLDNVLARLRACKGVTRPW